MQTKLNIKNFRVFDENGVDIQLSPITVLTGCNSSGKSSIVKAILLLDTFMQRIKIAVDHGDKIKLNEYSFDFSQFPLDSLGRFDKVVNRQSNSRTISFEYQTENDYIVNLQFEADKNDKLNRGFLKSLAISNDNGVVFCYERRKESPSDFVNCNLANIKDSFLRYIEGKLHEPLDNYFINGGLIAGFEIERKLNRDEFIKSTHITDEVLNWTKENVSLFCIPVLETLGCTDKTTFRKEVSRLLGDKAQEADLNVLIDRIDAMFSDSDAENFMDYFISQENEWLSNISSNCLDANFFENLLRNLCYTDNAFKQLLKLLADEKNPWLADCGLDQINFKSLYTFLMYVNSQTESASSKFFVHKNVIEGTEASYFGAPADFVFIHYLIPCFAKYVHDQIRKTQLPSWSGALDYIGSARVDVKRIYSVDEKDDFSRLLKKYFEANRVYGGVVERHNTSWADKLPDSFKDGYKPDAFMNKWVKKFGIGDKVSIEVDAEGLGVILRLHKNGDVRLLSEEGYGITQLFSILLQTETAIQWAYRPFLSEFGYMFTIDTETDKICFREQTIFIEEPEIHLHPKFQSLLADMFVEAEEKYNIHFVIETHSEYLIRRLQLLAAGKDDCLHIDREKVSIFYVNDADVNNRPQGEPHVKQIGICKDGYLDDEFGPGFFDEATSLSRKLM